MSKSILWHEKQEAYLADKYMCASKREMELTTENQQQAQVIRALLVAVLALLVALIFVLVYTGVW